MAESRKAVTRSVRPAAIEQRIHLIRGARVMLDRDLAALYRVPTKHLNQAVRRNASQFPPDFMFQLDADEASVHGGGRYRPRVFTEQGVAMLSSILKRRDSGADAPGTEPARRRIGFHGN